MNGRLQANDSEDENGKGRGGGVYMCHTPLSETKCSKQQVAK